MIQLITQLNYTISEILMHFIPHLNQSFIKKHILQIIMLMSGMKILGPVIG